MTEDYKVYWDSCAWLALIKKEQGRFDDLKKVYDLAKRGSIEIWTSTFTYAEVYKKQCGEGDLCGNRTRTKNFYRWGLLLRKTAAIRGDTLLKRKWPHLSPAAFQLF